MIRLNSTVGSVHSAVHDARSNLTSFQQSMSSPPTHDQVVEEANLCSLYSLALSQEEAFLKQKYRVTWLKNGDGNNKFFFNSCKSRWNANKILALEDLNGNTVTSHQGIAAVAVDYFQQSIGQLANVTPLPNDLHLATLSEDQANDLVKPVTTSEILAAFKKMAKSRSPGPDGFTAEFFLSSWNVIGGDVMRGILSFFNRLEMPRIINATAFVLVPKVPTPSKMSHFRPIACCNILYKCVTKILAKRMKVVMSSLVSKCQSAFVPGRVIGDNILLAQSLCHNYHASQGPQRCAIKLDISKAFDTLSWEFIVGLKSASHLL